MKRSAVAAGLLGLALIVTGVVFSVVVGDDASAFSGGFFTAVPLVGLVIIRARPTNVVAWCFLASGVLLGLEKSGEQLADEGLRQGWPDVVVHPLAWVQSWTWFPGLFVLVTVALLRFPDSRLIGARWRWAERASYAAMALWVAGLGSAAAVIPSRALMSSAEPDPHGWPAVAFTVGESMFAVIAVCGLFSLVSLVIRFRRGAVVEREQIKWVLSAATLAIVIETVLDVGGSVAGPWPGWTQSVGEGIGFALIAVSTGVAITRYRLYEIERIVSRTVAYVLVLIVLAGLYTGVLVGLAALVPADLGQVGVAAATLIVSVVAVPLTRRVRRVVDRRFNRSRFDAERVLAAFVGRLRARPEKGDVPADLLEVLQRTVQPSHAGVWLVPVADRAG